MLFTIFAVFLIFDNSNVTNILLFRLLIFLPEQLAASRGTFAVVFKCSIQIEVR